MAEQKTEKKPAKEEFSEKRKFEKKPSLKKEPEKKHILDSEILIRILNTDIPGDSKLFAGLTRIKGVSWSISNAVCNKLGIDKNKKIQDLSKQEIESIQEFLKNPSLPRFILNRRFDRETGKDSHILTTDLELKKEFDIRHLKKIKSYKGWRHAMGQPVRGQRTRSHFRKGRALGVQRAKTQAQRPAAEKKKGKGKK